MSPSTSRTKLKLKVASSSLSEKLTVDELRDVDASLGGSSDAMSYFEEADLIRRQKL
jgi:hypothetical protein